MSNGKNNPPKIKYSLLMSKRTKVESSSIKANNAIMSATKERRAIPMRKESKNSPNALMPNRGKLPAIRNIIIPQNIPTINILISVLK
jgi:hypothetical protein